MTISTETLKTQTKVLEWTEGLCKALERNYRDYHVRSMQSMNARDGGSSYCQAQLKAVEDGTANLMRFRVQNGKKYYKVIQQDYDTFQDRNEYRDGSVHAFIDKNTGEVYKPASWKSPAKHVRYDMRIINQREFLHNSVNTGWAGGYLYMR